MKRYTNTIFILFVAILTVSACKDSNKNNSTNSASADISVSKDADTVKVEINASDKMKYDRSKIDIYEGQTVVLTLHHTGKMSKETMGHNFVLLKDGISRRNFDKKAQKYKDNDYIPEDTKDVIAHTKLLSGGESDTVTFKAPEVGAYDYLCTFPGHEPNMNGVFTVHKK